MQNFKAPLKCTTAMWNFAISAKFQKYWDIRDCQTFFHYHYHYKNFFTSPLYIENLESQAYLRDDIIIFVPEIVFIMIMGNSFTTLLSCSLWNQDKPTFNSFSAAVKHSSVWAVYTDSIVNNLLFPLWSILQWFFWKWLAMIFQKDVPIPAQVQSTPQWKTSLHRKTLFQGWLTKRDIPWYALKNHRPEELVCIPWFSMTTKGAGNVIFGIQRKAHKSIISMCTRTERNFCRTVQIFSYCWEIKIPLAPCWGPWPVTAGGWEMMGAIFGCYST